MVARYNLLYISGTETAIAWLTKIFRYEIIRHTYNNHFLSQEMSDVFIAY